MYILSQICAFLPSYLKKNTRWEDEYVAILKDLFELMPPISYNYRP